MFSESNAEHQKLISVRARRGPLKNSDGSPRWGNKKENAGDIIIDALHFLIVHLADILAAAL